MSHNLREMFEKPKEVKGQGIRFTSRCNCKIYVVGAQFLQINWCSVYVNIITMAS